MKPLKKEEEEEMAVKRYKEEVAGKRGEEEIRREGEVMSRKVRCQGQAFERPRNFRRRCCQQTT